MPAFSHLEEGTSERVWQAERRLRSAPLLDVSVDELVVVASHPDDETLGAAGVIQRVHARGGGVTVIVVTDGEASHPDSVSHSRTDLRVVRRGEVLRAVHALAPGARVHFLALADGGLREGAADLERALAAILDGLSAPLSRTLVVAPWSGDGHRDHRVTAEAVGRLTAERGVAHLGYPIWLWHWGGPDDVPWDAAVVLSLTPEERSLKARALRTHVSQMSPLSDSPGDEAIVSESMHAHFARDIEFFLRERPGDAETLQAAFFDDFHGRHDDPWGFETRWYEERKRAILMASLPSRALGRVLEIGCSTGLVTRELAERSEHVLAIDASTAAVDAASERLRGYPNAVVRRAAVPGDEPDGQFDAIVLSEVGYYLSRHDLAQTISLIDDALAPGGFLVACHWRHRVAEYPLSGDHVHRALRSVDSWERISLHEEEDFVLEVFCRRPAVSVARREGLR